MDTNIDVDDEFDDLQETQPATSSNSDSQFQEPNNEKRWRLSYLKDQFECLELHNLFDRYTQRISHGYFSQFLTLQIILITAHFIILLSASDPKEEEPIPDIILYGLTSAFSIVLLIITDKYVKKHPNLLKYLASVAFIVTFFMNAFIPFYYRKRERYGNLRPAYSTCLIISNYIFLNIHNDLVALVVGLFVSLFHIVTLILVTYENVEEKYYQRLGSDAIYLMSTNGLGMYFRYMNEIVIRRSFLDRRSCVESTHQLKFEEDQENQLMSSIIPQHIISQVRKAIMKYWNYEAARASVFPKQKPFENLYVEEHPDVSILFADIVNYTAMTTTLDVTELLEVLNELFGSFDDASAELKVLRIKFLGDCYYCVAGLPPDPAKNHAEACVDLGLRMISIIADIRERKHLNINMRIGVHSGKISSGIIGTIKWQYDIWSTDVDIANKMETEGTAGMVHVTKKTKDLLKKTYNMAVTKKIINNERTFLIAPDVETKTESIPNGIKEEKTITFKEIIETNASKQVESNGNQRRPTIFIKRNSTVPNDLRAAGIAAAAAAVTAVAASSATNIDNPHRSYSLINNYRALQENNENVERNNVTGKRHTFPNSTERRISGNAGLGYFQRRPSTNAKISIDRRLTNSDRKRRTAFMNNNIKRYKERLAETNKELEDTIENMLLSKYEQWFKGSDMYRLLLVFKDLKSEMDFIKMPDPLFKYYLLSEILLVVLVFILQNLTLATWSWPEVPFYVTLGIIILLFLPLSWTYHIWSRYIAKFETDVPRNKIINFLYNTSKLITNNVLIRVLMYTVLYMLFCSCVLIEWLECIPYSDTISDNKTVPQKQNFLFLLAKSVNYDTSECLIPWHMTETCGLAIIISFLYLRMYMWLKLLYASTITIVYSYCILQYSGAFYGDSQTFNYSLHPQISHIMAIVFLTLTLHLVDRQTEYMNRLDHLWYKSLIQKEKQASNVHTVNNMLLKNILPLHVAELYLNVNRNSSEEVYHEYYNDVAVMFASIMNFSVEEMGQSFLKIMSAIISEFDMLLIGNTFGRPIEKIKIAKWTYMAACGVAPGLGNTENIRKDQRNHVVIALVKFAASLMQKLKSMNSELPEYHMKLRIGISYGSIAAGVVGSKKPLYDIWGDPVNMASRMDTTGLPDHIQVLKSTAEIIEKFGYVCEDRGEIKVKGKEHLVPTYYVALDENFNLKKRDITE